MVNRFSHIYGRNLAIELQSNLKNMICGGVCQVIIKRKENVPCSRDPGFGHNKVRDSGNVKGIRYLTATGKAGLAKIWARMRD